MFDPNPELDALLQKLLHPELKAIDPSLDRIEKLLAALGNPQLHLPPVIHIAGTNGKGSLLAMLRSILKAAGYRVHAYTSPHLVHFNERIMLNHQPISNEVLIPLLERVYQLQSDFPATFFEATTAVAYLAFAAEPADFILLETGMGGRLDATNVIPHPAVTAITPIGMDHGEFLGDTLQQIALEKAGIMKRQSACIIGPQMKEAQYALEHQAGKMGTPFYSHETHWNYQFAEQGWEYRGGRYSDHYPLPALHGAHQVANAATALAVLEKLEISLTPKHISDGLQQTIWPARLQPLNSGYWRDMLPEGNWRIVLDGGHNPHAAHAIANWLYDQPEPRYLLLGMLKNKDLRGYLEPLHGLIHSVYATDIPGEAGTYPAWDIDDIARGMGYQSQAFTTPEAAMEQIAAQPAGTILIAGSLYLAGYVLKINELLRIPS